MILRGPPEANRKKADMDASVCPHRRFSHRPGSVFCRCFCQSNENTTTAVLWYSILEPLSAPFTATAAALPLLPGKLLVRERNGWNGGLTDELVGPTLQYYTYTGIIPRTDSNLNRCADRQPKVTFQQTNESS